MRKVPDSRPDPDEPFSIVHRQERQKLRGTLKVFLGYAAGVGKTYTMLEAAHQRVREGLDVVIGCVETHGMVETEARLVGLERLFTEPEVDRDDRAGGLDVDAVLARRPELVLVDELAHTNSSGSRHPRRYQDVEEFLTAGIDVYTTLNIQHLESLNDVIAQITGVTVRETVPDSVLDQVTEIELADLPPDELLNRLQEGKVYVPDQAARAIRNFYRKGNLTALRELTMRLAARRVDDQMRDYMKTRAIDGPWPAAERLLVGVSPHPLADRLVRAARRLADELNAEWTVVYVEVPGHSRMTAEARDRIARTLLLAEELGGTAISLPGYSVPGALLSYAVDHNVTKIIIGKPLRPRWKEFLFGSVVDRLVRISGNIDVYLINDPAGGDLQGSARGWRPHRPLGRYIWAVALVGAATGIGALFQRGVTPPNLVMVYLLAVVVAAVYLGRGPAVLASILGVLVFDFIFTEPYFTFAVEDTEYILTFIGLLGVGLVISELTARVRDQADSAGRREAETATLYGLSRDLSVVDGLEEVIAAVTANVAETFGRDTVVFLPDGGENGELEVANQALGFEIDEHEMTVAAWSFRFGRIAGRGTETLSGAAGRYIPLRTLRGVVGVLGVKPKEAASQLSPDQRRLLETFSHQAAMAIERARLAEQAQESQLLQATEKLQTALLNSISHDLRTPLVTVIGALSSLAGGTAAMNPDVHRDLIETASAEADRMNRLIGNLLHMTRMEAGALHVNEEPGDIQDAIGTALENLKDHLAGREILLDIAEDLPLIPMDFVLVVQVLVNLIDNALKYSAAGTPVEIRAGLAGRELEVLIGDRGIGIPQKDLERIFEKFYRVQRPDKVSGTGLGLSISRGIIEAHSGRIRAEKRAGGGTEIRFYLPVGA